MQVRRKSDVVELVAEGLKLSGVIGTGDIMSALGPGWRPQAPVYSQSVRYWSTSVSAPIRVWTDASIRAATGSAADPELYFHVVYMTGDAPPASLPGAPV